jgi:hypothetical protein
MPFVRRAILDQVTCVGSVNAAFYDYASFIQSSVWFVNCISARFASFHVLFIGLYGLSVKDLLAA